MMEEEKINWIYKMWIPYDGGNCYRGMYKFYSYLQ